MDDDWADRFAAADAQLTTVYETVMLPRLFEPWAEVLTDALAVAAGTTVVDVATGPGTVARAVARRVGVIGRVIGCDVSPGMIESARAHPPESGAAPIEYVLCPADALEIGDAIADGVSCQHGLQFFPDRVAALAEMRRVCRPGGRLAVAVWGPLEQTPMFAALASGIGEVFGAEAATGYRSGPWALTGSDELRALATDAGWRDIDVLPRDMPIEFASPTQLVTTLAITPLGPQVVALDQARRHDLVEAVTRALGPALDDDGAVRSSSSALFLVAAA
jgi:SAM-dependent methyltransferase